MVYVHRLEDNPATDMARKLQGRSKLNNIKITLNDIGNKNNEKSRP